MSSPEDKTKHRQRIRSHIARDLESNKYRQRVKDNARKKKIEELKFRELVEAIQTDEDL